MKLRDAKPNQVGFKLIQTGEPGSGKTYRACSAAKFGPVFVIDTDNKLIGLKNRLPAEWVDQIDVETPTTSDAYMAIMRNLDSLPKKYSTVVLDTMSRAYDRMVDNMKQLNPKGDGRQIYGAAYSANVELINKLFSLPMNVIVNTHVGMEEMEDGTKKLTSSTAGKFGATLPQYVNEVHYCHLNLANKPKVRGEPSSIVVARTVVDKKYLDSSGLFLVEDLSIFEPIAYKVGA